MSITTSAHRTGRALVSDALFRRLTDRIVQAEGFDRDLADRIMDQALAFLVACVANVGDPLAPSELVDIGWHTFLLDTGEYAAFCDRVAGRFIHHVPNDDEAAAEAPDEILARSVTAMRTLGFHLDDALWPSSALGSCTGCHNGCHNDPPPSS
ncbi:glycine-rich domain-containing protein [Amycolatopsis sp. NPDC098790]|uniref:glycine-rich domain-containing protein n=1 Tax=Amycolatopsis sp. NPDC098790 TaxID=3363939 RepID=UPI0037F71D72